MRFGRRPGGALVLAAILAVAGCASPPSPSVQAVATPSIGATPGPTISTAAKTPSSTPSDPTPSATTRTPTPSRTPPPTYGATLIWNQEYLPRPPGVGTLGGSNARASDITVTGAGFVIVGTDLDDRGNEVAASWTSPDGITWQEHLTTIRDHPGYSLSEVAAGIGALVAVGSRGIWRSTDGATWEQVGQPAMLGTFQTDVAWGRDGFVAIGRGDRGTASIWLSADGLAWEQAPGATALSGFCPLKIAGGPKGYVAVGFGAVGSVCGDSTQPAIAVSADGRQWVRAPEQPSLTGEGASIGAVAGGPGWIAFGPFQATSTGDQGTAVWTSSDGLAWRRTSFLRPVPPYVPDCGKPYGPAYMVDITAFGPGYVAVGVSSCGNDQWGTAWASPDGATWHSVRLNPTTDARFWLMRAVAARDGQLVAAAGTPWVDYLPAVVSAVLGP